MVTTFASGVSHLHHPLQIQSDGIVVLTKFGQPLSQLPNSSPERQIVLQCLLVVPCQLIQRLLKPSDFPLHTLLH